MTGPLVAVPPSSGPQSHTSAEAFSSASQSLGLRSRKMHIHVAQVQASVSSIAEKLNLFRVATGQKHSLCTVYLDYKIKDQYGMVRSKC